MSILFLGFELVYNKFFFSRESLIKHLKHITGWNYGLPCTILIFVQKRASVFPGLKHHSPPLETWPLLKTTGPNSQLPKVTWTRDPSFRELTTDHSIELETLPGPWARNKTSPWETERLPKHFADSLLNYMWIFHCRTYHVTLSVTDVHVNLPC